MKVYVCEQDKTKQIEELSVDVQHSIRKALFDVSASNQEFSDALSHRVCELENMINIEYLPERLTFFVVNNLRSQQDGVKFTCPRFETLQEAIHEYESLPKEYTSALGGYLGENKCIDFVHRRNGKSVLVNDFLKIDDWRENGLVKQSIDQLIGRLSIKYEHDTQTLGPQYAAILVPLRRSESLNSYFADKFLSPAKHNDFLSSINEVYVEGEGWLAADEFFKRLKGIDSFASTKRMIVSQYNIRYVDEKGRKGQADLSAADFAFLKTKSEMNLNTKRDINVQISDAKIRKAEATVHTCHDDPVR